MNANQLLLEPSKPWWACEAGPRNPHTPGGKSTFTFSGAVPGTVAVATGSGIFPIDMMRYDHAWCLTAVPHPEHSWIGGHTYKVLVGFSKPYKPSSPRWDSFGWVIKVTEFKAPVIKFLQTRTSSWRGCCHRCYVKAQGFGMSYFDSRFICSICEEQERAHPDFNLALHSQRRAMVTSDWLFKGIGWLGVTGRHR